MALDPRRRRPVRGQAMTENIIMVTMVAIATIGVVSLMGDNMRGLFGASADALGGSTSVANPGQKSSSVRTSKTLKTFGLNDTSSGGTSGGGSPPDMANSSSSGGTSGGGLGPDTNSGGTSGGGGCRGNCPTSI